MRDNRSPYWRQRAAADTAPAGPAPAGRGPAGRAPAGPAPAGRAPAGKAPAGRDEGAGQRGAPPATMLLRAGRSPRRFTVHLGFEAADPGEALELAVGYAEALSLLRPELALGASALSPADAWHRAERLFCGSVGPDDEHCVDVAGHPGFHHAPGPGGLGWGDGDRPPADHTGRDDGD
ncbi:hypothetical protein ACN28G_19255 [Micromonospora sp. WMMA1923]|uniref:hypothetical protein n=1 Tax=Micromonospora sp. WMMA1923 TaxID=3404125 RepID=UPI003B925DBE